MNEGLFSAYEALPQWKTILDKARSEGCAAVCGLSEGERAFFAAALARRTGRPVLLVSPTELTAQKQAQDIERLFGGAAALPARDVQFSRAAASQESTWQRLQVLGEAARLRVLCVSAESLVDRCVPAKRFAGAAITLTEGGRYAPEALISALLRAGYERVPMVEGRGQCAMRGSILDVFPPSEPDALRVEFFDDEVDSIRRFDCISQRSIARVKSARLTPATECLIADPEAAAERLRTALEERDAPKAPEKPAIAPAEAGPDELPSLEAFLAGLDALDLDERPDAAPPSPEIVLAKPGGHRSPPADNGDTRAAKAQEPRLVSASEREAALRRKQDDIDTVRAGHPPRTGPMWMNVLCDSTVTALDYLPNAVVICDQPDQVQLRVKARREAYQTEWEEALRRGDAVERQRELPYEYADLLSALSARPVLLLSDLTRGLGQFAPDTTVELQSEPIAPYQSRLEPLCKDILTWKEQGCAIVLLSGGEARGERLKKALTELNAPCVYADSLEGNAILREVLILPATMNKGFRHIAAKLVVVSDADLYGTHYQRAKKRQTAGERIASFTDLKPGDYVVHDTHGVGVFDGVVQMASEGVKRDYLLIRYAGNDKLYVPTDQFDRVQKFIGAEQNPPKLNRLGGQEWERQKSKVKASLKKLAFDLAALYARRQTQPGYAFAHDTPWRQEFEDGFPYELTVDQQQSVEQIEADMESDRNMDRLLCGDVGYGKTEVALRAAFKAVVEGKQVAILAPTTILVQQHFNTVRRRFSGFPVTVDMLSRFKSAKEQKDILARLAEGKIDLIVGTHRLLAKDVKFKDLGLLVIDEEHRFGVAHKEAIKNIKSKVDVLTLSATPIPRTLHMSMVGIRDMSILETPPEERMPVKTYVIEYDDRVIQEAIKRELARGGQVYFLYNRVRSIEQMYARLKTLVPEARIGVAHGQMRENALEDVMLDFYAGAFDVLLCTTIIESGLDVPEANTLIVFDADRFGLSQLYQIRGRVGRSNRQAYAYLTIRRDKLLSETAEKRLSAIREFTEFGAGYRIAMRDLEIRGAGDVLGPEQHGHLSTVGYDMYLKLIEQAVDEAQGKERAPELDTRVELSIDAYLPEEYIADEKLRVETYKRIAMIDDAQTRIDVEDELTDRYGDPPAPVVNLMNIARLRAVTRRLGVSRLFLKPDGLHLRLDEKFLPDPAALYAAATACDKRLAFSMRQPPELLLRQKDMTPEQTLAEGTRVLDALLESLRAHSCQPAPEMV